MPAQPHAYFLHTARRGFNCHGCVNGTDRLTYESVVLDLRAEHGFEASSTLLTSRVCIIHASLTTACSGVSTASGCCSEHLDPDATACSSSSRLAGTCSLCIALPHTSSKAPCVTVLTMLQASQPRWSLCLPLRLVIWADNTSPVGLVLYLHLPLSGGFVRDVAVACCFWLLMQPFLCLRHLMSVCLYVACLSDLSSAFCTSPVCGQIPAGWDVTALGKGRCSTCCGAC